MHIGLLPTSGPSLATTTSTGKSVGQRLKDASSLGKECPTMSNGVSNGHAIDHSVKGAILRFGGQHERRTQPTVLSELQKNTVRVIGQYLRELGMQ